MPVVPTLASFHLDITQVKISQSALAPLEVRAVGARHAGSPGRKVEARAPMGQYSILIRLFQKKNL